ncbi:MAG: hypothetical protein B7Z40_08625 [Bosea sp. 12-68-7]|nr:MAG: hypothetical protein B7Z40_08625 [Bosea sp. 12-68-7]
MNEDDWKRLADAYRDYVPPEPVVDTDPEVAKRRDAARDALGNMRLAGGVPSPEFLALTDRWIAGELDEEEVIAEIKRLSAPANPS